VCQGKGPRDKSLQSHSLQQHSQVHVRSASKRLRSWLPLSEPAASNHPFFSELASSKLCRCLWSGTWCHQVCGGPEHLVVSILKYISLQAAPCFFPPWPQILFCSAAHLRPSSRSQEKRNSTAEVPYSPQLCLMELEVHRLKKLHRPPQSTRSHFDHIQSKV